jgi:hypothetical protein
MGIGTSGHPVLVLIKSSYHFLFSQPQFDNLTLEVRQEGGGTDQSTKPIMLVYCAVQPHKQTLQTGCHYCIVQYSHTNKPFRQDVITAIRPLR